MLTAKRSVLSKRGGISVKRSVHDAQVGVQRTRSNGFIKAVKSCTQV